jgi:ParB family chromosome partitioning protein
MTQKSAQAVEMIPVDLIDVVNPRARNQKIFKEITASIAEIGLKKPITVSRREHADGHRYDLVCGQGRLEAFLSLGQREIPALVVNANNDDCLVMSLVENVARRQHRAIDLLQDIAGLKQRGYCEKEIAAKTGPTLEYTKGVLRLLESGEQRLLRAVETRQIPVSIAVQIAESDDVDTQRVLQQAYENNQLRGRKLLAAKRLIEQRRRKGKNLRTTEPKRERNLSVTGLLRTYRESTDKKHSLVRKAEATRERLVFVTEALRKLVADENFNTLLRAEGFGTLPSNLNDRLHASAAG